MAATHGHGHGHDADHGHGHAAAATHDGPTHPSEGSVMLAFCAALAIGLGGAVAGTRKAPAHEDPHGSAGHTVATEPGHERGVADPHHVEAAHEDQEDSRLEARGEHAGVATAAPEATRAALDVLAEGGNAFDALVAASFAVSVVRPQSTGIGGGGFALCYDAAAKKTLVLDGREVAPGAASEAMFLDASGNPTRESQDGPRAAGVPGLVAMLARLHAEKGKLKWARLVEPAIKLAREGFVVPASLARAIAEREPVLRRFPASAAVFLRDGRPLAAGDKLVQEELAQTLEAIAADGANGFYRGRVAQRIADATTGGITLADLGAYTVTSPQPLVGKYRGMQVVTMPPPSSGGALLLQMLNVLGSLRAREQTWHSPAHLHLLTEAMRRAFADRNHIADPAFVDVPTAWLTSPEYGAQVAAGIDREQATPSSELRLSEPPAGGKSHTTHISIVDAQGNAASSTQTINGPLGSGFVVSGTGILLNDEMDDFAAKVGGANLFGLVQGEKNMIRPGKRPLSSMTPTIVLDGEGRVRLVVGSPGGPKIITAVLQVLMNVVDHEMGLAAALAAPRVHHQFLADQLVVEPGLPRATLDSLAGMGHTLLVHERADLGLVQAVQVRSSGERVAATDPRGDGLAGAR